MRHRRGSALAFLAFFIACGGEAQDRTTTARPASAAGGDSASRPERADPTNLAPLSAPSDSVEGWHGLTLPDWLGSPEPTAHFATEGGERRLSYSSVGGARLDARPIAGSSDLVFSEIEVSRDLGLLAGYRVGARAFEVWDLERGRIVRRPSREGVERVVPAGDALVLVRVEFTRTGRRVRAEVHGRRAMERFALPSERVVMVSDDVERILLVLDRGHVVVDRAGAVLGRCEPGARSALSPGGTQLACFTQDAIVVTELASSARRRAEVDLYNLAGPFAIDDEGRVATLDRGELVFFAGSDVQRRPTPAGLPTSSASMRMADDEVWLNGVAVSRRWSLDTGRADPSREVFPVGASEMRRYDAPHVDFVHRGWRTDVLTRWNLVTGSCESMEPRERTLPPHLARLEGHPALERIRERHGAEILDVAADGSRVLLRDLETHAMLLVDGSGEVVWTRPSSEAAHCIDFGRPPVFLPGDTAFVTCAGSLVNAVVRDADGQVLERLDIGDPRATAARGIYRGSEGWLGLVERTGVVAQTRCEGCVFGAAGAHPDGSEIAVAVFRPGGPHGVTRFARSDLARGETTPIDGRPLLLSYLPDGRVLALVEGRGVRVVDAD